MPKEGSPGTADLRSAATASGKLYHSADLIAPRTGGPQSQGEQLLTTFRGLSGKIVVFGGSFDPVHNAHLIVAEEAARRVGAETVVFVPTSQNPLKTDAAASAAQRLEMVRLAIAGRAGWFVSDIETRSPGPAYTIDLLRQIEAETLGGAQVFLVVGADGVASLPAWNDFHTIFTLASIIPVSRPGSVAIDRIGDDQRFTKAEREVLDRNAIRDLAVNQSSTAIRRELRDRPSRLVEQVPVAVAEYIRLNQLYGVLEKPNAGGV